LRVSKFFFIIAIIYLLWIGLLLIGVFFLELGNKWAIFSIEQWILSAIFLISVVIGLEVVFLLHYLLTKRKHFRPERQQPRYAQGKEVMTYTIPAEAQGGIFSKTFIPIDENRVLHLRYQMIPPKNLWGQKE
jgi:hypothetical protein